MFHPGHKDKMGAYLSSTCLSSFFSPEFPSLCCQPDMRDTLLKSPCNSSATYWCGAAATVSGVFAMSRTLCSYQVKGVPLLTGQSVLIQPFVAFVSLEVRERYFALSADSVNVLTRVRCY